MSLFPWPPQNWFAPVEEAAAPEPVLPDPTLAPVPPPVETPTEPPPVEPPPMGMQPGLGIPAPVVDQSIATMPMPDAVSGVDAEPIAVPPPAGPPEVQAEQLPAPESPYFDAASPQSWNKSLSSADLYQMAKSDPVGYAQHISEMDRVAAEEMRRKQAEVDNENATREERNYQDFIDSQNEANKLRDKLLDQKVDANRWMKSRSPLQTIAAYLSVVVGGLYQARKGGPNIGLEMMDKAIDQDIAEQQANMANQRNAIADLRAQGMSDFQAKQAYRVAWYQRAREQVLTSMQDYDPAGTIARQHAQQALELESRIAQAAEMGRRDKLKEELERRKDMRETMETAAKLRKSDAETAKLLRPVGGGGAAKLDKTKFTPEQLATMNPGLPVPQDGLARTPGEYRAWLGTQKDGTELLKAQDERGRSTKKLQVAGIVQDDGKTPYEFASDNDADEFRAAKQAAEAANELVGDISRGIEKHGGSSGLIKSKDWQTITAKVASLDNLLRMSGKMGSLDEGAINLVQRMRGGTDPNSFINDARPGLKAARDALVSNLNAGLRQQPGYRGKMLSIGDIGGDSTALPVPKKTASDKVIDRAVKHRVLTDERPVEYLSPGDRTMAERVAKENALVQSDIEALAATAQSDGPEAAKAQAALKAIITTATDPTVRGWASDALMAAATPATLSGSATPEVVR